MTPLLFTVERVIRHWAKYRRSECALWTPNGQWSYGDLATRADLVASHVSQLLPYTGSPRRIAIAADDFAALAGWCGILRAGHSFVPVNVDLEPAIAASLLRELGCELVLIEAHKPWITLFRDSAQVLDLKVMDLSNLADGPPHSAPTKQISFNHETEVAVLFTSGSSGNPLPVPKSHYSLFTELVAWQMELSIRKLSRFALAQPFYYTGALMIGLSTLVAGGTVGVCRREELLEDLDALRPTHLFLVPSQYDRLVDSLTASNKRLDAIEVSLLMGDRVPSNTKNALRRLVAGEQIESWGNTEGLGTIASSLDRLCPDNSVGRPFITDEIYIRGSLGVTEDGYDVGKIVGRSDSCFTPGIPALVDETGSTVSNDVGFVDEAGYLHLLGRSDEVLNVAGFVIAISTLEDAFLANSDVRQVVVIPGPRPNGQIELHAFIVFTRADAFKSFDIAAINASLSHRFRIHHWSALSELPRN